MKRKAHPYEHLLLLLKATPHNHRLTPLYVIYCVLLTHNGCAVLPKRKRCGKTFPHHNDQLKETIVRSLIVRIVKSQYQLKDGRQEQQSDYETRTLTKSLTKSYV